MSEPWDGGVPPGDIDLLLKEDLSETELVDGIGFLETMLCAAAIPKLKNIQETHPSQSVRHRAAEAVKYLSDLL